MEEKITTLVNSMDELVNSYLDSIADADAFANLDELEEKLVTVNKLTNIANLLGQVITEYNKNADELIKQNRKLERIAKLLEE